MIANYHTHTTRCKHAIGKDEDYCVSAIESGLSILGYSDHTPYPFDKGYESSIRMSVDELDDYTNSISGIRTKYKDKIRVRLGLEVEYYPNYFDRLMKLVEGYPIDYLILGQHFVKDEVSGIYVGARTVSSSLLESYVKQSIEGFATGKFAYFAHPDLIFYEGDIKEYDKWMHVLCEGARDYNMPLEINLQGIFTNRNYPNDRFWKIAGEEGNTVILGSDAHEPAKVYDKDAENKALCMVEKYNLKLIETLPMDENDK